MVYVGRKGDGAPAVVLEGLKRLEYRGYDSWGIAALDSRGRLATLRRVGKIGGASADRVTRLLGSGSVAVGHTRWATHGGISERNAHPQVDCKGRVAIVHNGIIENYQELKAGLVARKHRFASETDTEILAHYIEEGLARGQSFSDATRSIAKRLKGRSAFIAMDSKGGQIAAVRLGAPLIVGIGKKGEMFVSSDVNGFLERTNKVMYIDDGEMALLSFGKKAQKAPEFLNVSRGTKVRKRIIGIDWKRERESKLGYDHFLIKEIMEQKHTIAQAINQDDAKMRQVANRIKNAFGVFIVGAGTAGRVCAAGEYLFSDIAKRHVNSTVASEFSSYRHYLTKKTLMIAVSQSGETVDLLDAIDVAKSKGARILSLVNVFGSTLMRVSDDFLMLNAGAEKAVASTKATTAQLSLLTLLAYATAGRLKEGKRLLLNTAEQVNDMLNPRYEERIKRLARRLRRSRDVFIIGRGVNYPIAEEAAIKLQETSYIHAHGFAGGELKHGPLALISRGSPCIALVANDDTKHETISNAMEVKARGGYVIGVAPENNEVFDYWLKVPDAGVASPIVNIIPVQVLAYHLAVLRGINPDYPRNLAKSVTVK
ncbi:MAG: glutamine--fructose-6-phosphate transaminase (isomerizing) [Candidatus Micrarchaeota archaeon]|nr:glutamine--fructose-6-phosphate transaminase (isomerizing) [Candidatus Micrarchaeota archaeon]